MQASSSLRWHSGYVLHSAACTQDGMRHTMLEDAVVSRRPLVMGLCDLVIASPSFHMNMM
jgi:hypothetical protein